MGVKIKINLLVALENQCFSKIPSGVYDNMYNCYNHFIFACFACKSLTLDCSYLNDIKIWNENENKDAEKCNGTTPKWIIFKPVKTHSEDLSWIESTGNQRSAAIYLQHPYQDWQNGCVQQGR